MASDKTELNIEYPRGKMAKTLNEVLEKAHEILAENEALVAERNANIAEVLRLKLSMALYENEIEYLKERIDDLDGVVDAMIDEEAAEGEESIIDGMIVDDGWREERTDLDRRIENEDDGEID